MKKLAIGCLIILVLGIGVVGVGSYIIYRAASPLIEDARSYVQEMSQLTALEDNIDNKSPFTAPSSGELTEQQVQRFARVHQHVRSALGQRMTALEAKYKDLEARAERNVPLGIGEVWAGLRDITNVYVEARRFQVEALNKEGFSQGEYAWVRDQMFRAAGMEISGRIDLQKLEDAVRQTAAGADVGNLAQDIRSELPRIDVPAKNRELVKPLLEQMDEWLPLVFLGL